MATIRNLLNTISIVIISTILVVLCDCSSSVDVTLLPPPCNSSIYCYGDLLHTVQMAGIYRDSKTFVDMKLKKPPNETLVEFDKFMQETNYKPSKRKILDFVQTHFEKPGMEFEKWNLSDWTDRPKFLERIRDDEYRNWASYLNQLWNFLGRKMTDDVEQNRELYSIIYVPNPVIVPGGRFREFYYWDSYWIIKGLLLSEMYDTVKGMLLNFLSIVDMFGFIPNGGRVYYAGRSQPPLLIPMIRAYVETTNDWKFINENLPRMEKEFEYWLAKHTVNVTYNDRVYEMFTYGDCTSGPRPESYREDIHSAKQFHTEKDKNEFYAELKAAAESGWDFSSRWFIKEDGSNEGNLTNLRTRSIIPVELNAIMYWNAKILEDFNTQFHNETAMAYYSFVAQKIKESVTDVLWDKKQGVWLDYDMINSRRRNYFYPTNISPLWTDCYDKSSNVTEQVMQYLWRQNEHLITMAEMPNRSHLGGFPTTFYFSGEQWDYPNAWPPLQYMMIMALNNTGNVYAQELAFELADRWVRTNFIAYNQTKNMYEKYDSRKLGAWGGGGEYEVQEGFGWTNGIVLELLDRYGDKLQAIDRFNDAIEKETMTLPNMPTIVQAGAGETRTFITALLVITISLIAGFIGIVACKLYIAQNDYRHANQPTTVGAQQFPARTRGQYKELHNMYEDAKRKPR